MKKLIYCCLAVAAFTFLHSCADQDEASSDTDIQTELSKVRYDGEGDPDGGGGGSCVPEGCTGLGNSYWSTWNANPYPDECKLCVFIVIPEGDSGELCVLLTGVVNNETGEEIDDITFSGTIETSGEVCYEFDHDINFQVQAFFYNEDGCTNNSNLGYQSMDCFQCCDTTTIGFTEVGTDDLYQTDCGDIEVNLETECPGPWTWEYSPEAGTGLKASGSGSGDVPSFIIDVQNDCGLLGPGNYTVTFTNGDCTFTEDYYFEPCNTDLYDPNNPAAMQMTDLKIKCSSNGYAIRMISQTVAKCCSCTSVTIKLTNGDGLVTEFNGPVTMEAGCQPATSYFKKILRYSFFYWTPCCNILEVVDCEGNTIYSKYLDDPCI